MRRSRGAPRKGPRRDRPMKGSGDYHIGKEVGSFLGDFAEKSFRSMFGGGDYAANFDVQRNNIMSPNQPIVGGTSSLNRSPREVEGAVNVRHREFIGDVSTGLSLLPATQLLLLEPTQSATFPWLSKLAVNFEQWVPHGIVFEYIPTSGNAVSSTNASLGSISMATQYDITAASFASKQQLLNHYFASSASPATAQTHPIECALDERPTPVLYTAAGVGRRPLPNPQPELQLYFLGFTTILGVGSQSAYVGGELWVTYDISLLKPRVATSPLGAASLAACYAEIEALPPEKRPQLRDLMAARVEAGFIAAAEEEEEKKNMPIYPSQQEAAEEVPPPSPLVRDATRLLPPPRPPDTSAIQRGWLG